SVHLALFGDELFGVLPIPGPDLGQAWGDAGTGLFRPYLQHPHGNEQDTDANGQEYDRDPRGRLPRERGEHTGERGQYRREQTDDGRDGLEAVQGNKPFVRMRDVQDVGPLAPLPVRERWLREPVSRQRKACAVSERPKGPLPVLEGAVCPQRRGRTE